MFLADFTRNIRSISQGIYFLLSLISLMIMNIKWWKLKAKLLTGSLSELVPSQLLVMTTISSHHCYINCHFACSVRKGPEYQVGHGRASLSMAGPWWRWWRSSEEENRRLDRRVERAEKILRESQYYPRYEGLGCRPECEGEGLYSLLCDRIRWRWGSFKIQYSRNCF